MHKRRWFFLAGLIVLLLVTGSAWQTWAARASEDAAVLAVARRVKLSLSEVAKGFEQPIFVTHAGDGSKRMFVLEQKGIIKLLDGTVFLDITSKVETSGSEQGLLGLAFDPQFRRNGFLYVHYTNRDGDTVIARFTAMNGTKVDLASEQRVLFVDDPAANHNGGMLAFGPDGMLYIALGDGGGANDTYKNGQNKQALLGKLLRIDVRTLPYSVPAANPFRNDAAFRPEIWAYGLRNPWRFSFDRATGDLYIGDVGQSQYESVLFQAAGRGGANYGWPITEGQHCRQANCDRSGLTAPVTEYPHSKGCSITGGYVYRGTQTALRGLYVFGDFCSGRIWTLERDAKGAWLKVERLQTKTRISSFGEDEAGELYVVDHGGSVYRLLGK